MFIPEKEKQILLSLEMIEIAAACHRCGGLSMEILGGSNRCPHCDEKTEHLAVPTEIAASCPWVDLDAQDACRDKNW